ncbi:MAG: DNA mismatch repair protein MutT, partial [Pseudomonadota bacterium]
LHGMFQNKNIFGRDYVAVYIAKDWTMPNAFVPNIEIREAKFFPMKNLPEGTTPGTRHRIAELLGLQTITPYWN